MHVSLPQPYCVGLSSNWVHSALAATWNPRLLNFSLTHPTLPAELLLGVNNDKHGVYLESPLPFCILGHLRRDKVLPHLFPPERMETAFWANFTISGLKIILFRDAESLWRKATHWTTHTTGLCRQKHPAVSGHKMWLTENSSRLQGWDRRTGLGAKITAPAAPQSIP